MREPPFWWRPTGGTGAALLAPAAAIYGAVAARRLARSGRRIGVPVVCVGNPTLGGAGKTPTALALVRLLQQAGERPVLLSRGYGGRLSGPVQVDPARHFARDVGDEPLLLARAAPTIVARDRVAGAKAARVDGASVIVMDDGFQNPSLVKDFSVLVVDASRGVGNGRIFPAGPLRAPLAAQVARAHALIVVGTGPLPAAVDDAAGKVNLPIFRARLAPDAGTIAALAGARLLAFAGIGDPEKFFATLRAAGLSLVATRSFPDHHFYAEAEAKDLRRHAGREGLVLVTTEKDLVRMQGEPAAAELAAQARGLPVTLVLERENAFKSLTEDRLRTVRQP
jgi:tetraacyldisaccharide 4'-kinase